MCCLSGVCVVPQPHPASRVLAALPLTTLWHTVFLQWRSRRDVCMARPTVMPRLHSQSSVLHNHRPLSEETGCEGKWYCFSADLGVCGGPTNPAPQGQRSFLQDSAAHACDHGLSLPPQQAPVCVFRTQRQSRARPRKATVFVLWTFSVSFPMHQNILHFVGLQTSSG